MIIKKFLRRGPKRKHLIGMYPNSICEDRAIQADD